MNDVLRLSLVFLFVALLPGCWVAHVAHDRPELRANVGRKAVLTEPYSLVRDAGGRLHLTKDGALAGQASVEKLPASSALEIKDVIYRISDPGRHDYYVIEISTSSGAALVEVPADDRDRPAWRYE
jgi:hypothetical protein